MGVRGLAGIEDREGRSIFLASMIDSLRGEPSRAETGPNRA